MKWKDIYELGIKAGLETDIREINVEGQIEDFYPDCAIITGNNDLDVKVLYAGVDVGVSELLLIDRLIGQGERIDGALAHHPTSFAAYRMAGVAELQKINWIKNGVDPGVAERLYQEIVLDESIDLRSKNHLAVESAAKLLGLPLMCLHTAVDNIVQSYFENILNTGKIHTVGEAFEAISGIKECMIASGYGDGPFMLDEESGDRSLGKYMVDMTGGVDPPSGIFEYLKKAGLDTLVGMHYGIENVRSISKNRINAIISGHMACDSLGLNILCDRLEKRGVKIIPGSGFYRYRR